MRKFLAGGLVLLATAVAAPAAFGSNYVVLYKQQAVGADAASTIAKAGGTLVYSYPQIGVVIARSESPSFRDNLVKDSKIENASSTDGFAIQLPSQSTDAEGPPPGDLPNTPATDGDTFSSLQWDMRQIHAPEAHVITGGSPSVVVGDIDTGLDPTHPDLASNVDYANSVSCIGGVPNQAPAAWFDGNGHGTHTAGTIAAEDNGIGIVGVAPNVKIAGIKAGTDVGGFFFPEAVVCAFMWAGSHHLDVTNNSYFADPFLFNCRNDPEQRAIWKSEQRAIRYAMSQGVTVVAAEGNESEDLSHPTMDVTSPDFPPGSEQEREVTNACVVIPVEIPGVVGVSATGSFLQGTNAGQYPDNLKSFYSSFGISTTDVAAPGGDSLFGTSPFTGVQGRVLSTWPAADIGACPVARRKFDPAAPGALWCYAQGTSMASPHAAGVAALIISRYGSSNNAQHGKLAPGRVAALLEQTADAQECPTMLPAGYSAIVGTQSGAPQTCVGGPGHNSWYGAGQVDALNAVTR